MGELTAKRSDRLKPVVRIYVIIFPDYLSKTQAQAKIYDKYLGIKEEESKRNSVIIGLFQIGLKCNVKCNVGCPCGASMSRKSTYFALT